MYLEHFNLKEFPFTVTPNTDFFCNLAGYQAALNVVLLSLRNGEGFLKVVGEVGAGKTLLCRMLLERLNDDFVTAYIPNPDLSPIGLRKALAQELGLPSPYPRSQHTLLEHITKQLIALHESGKRVVLLIDEAQAMSFECLEALRLLTNLETKTIKLLQVVLFGQPELNVKLNQPNMRQLKQRISFSHLLPPLTRPELDAYLCHRLAMAGHTTGTLFTRRACNFLFRKSRGIPRVINILCHKALMFAYGRGETEIHTKAMHAATHDTEYVITQEKLFIGRYILIGGLLLLSLLAGLKCYNLASNHTQWTVTYDGQSYTILS